MATIIWEPVKAIQCERVQNTAALLQERIYLHDSIAAIGVRAFHVRARRCSLGVECNIAGCACRWSGLNPDYDPFKDVIEPTD